MEPGPGPMGRSPPGVSTAVLMLRRPEEPVPTQQERVTALPLPHTTHRSPLVRFLPNWCLACAVSGPGAIL